MELEKFLIDLGLYESEEEAVRRKEVLGRIDQEQSLFVTVSTEEQSRGAVKVFLLADRTLGQKVASRLNVRPTM